MLHVHKMEESTMKKWFCFFLICLLVVALRGYAIGLRASDEKTAITQKRTKQIQKIVHDYIINHPEVILEAGKKLQEKEELKRKEQLKKVQANIAKYKKEIFATDTAGRVVADNPKRKIIIAEFTQYQCPHCKEMMTTITKLLKNNPDVQLITIYWPFFGNDAIYAAKAVLAAQKQNKFAVLNNKLLAVNDFITKDKVDEIIKSTGGINTKKLYADMEAKEISDGLKDNLQLAKDLGLLGTPTIIFTNSDMTKFKLIPGQTSDIENDLKQALDELR